MRSGKKPTRGQRKFLEEKGYSTYDWLIVQNTNDYMIVQNRYTGLEKVIFKED